MKEIYKSQQQILHNVAIRNNSKNLIKMITKNVI